MASHMSVYPVPSCAECGLESAGRCPTCKRSLCIDHFGCEAHEPCATRLVKHADDYVCYVCGLPVKPRQWSTAVFAHYIDSGTCMGCKRSICDGQHTSVLDEAVEIGRDGLRSHRYHVTQRYCGVCAPLRRVGGLLGVSRLAVAALGAGVVAFLVIRGGAL